MLLIALVPVENCCQDFTSFFSFNLLSRDKKIEGDKRIDEIFQIHKTKTTNCLQKLDKIDIKLTIYIRIKIE